MQHGLTPASLGAPGTMEPTIDCWRSWTKNLPPRFDELVLVSGDRIYAEKISELAGQGLPTTVYAHNFALSKRLAFAATNVINTTTQAVQAA
ncbi:NYN domain-containing protein [Corynebacterium diphtheriae]|nr:NYN domain-containing protein [Corynebacterium diphtheriae]